MRAKDRGGNEMEKVIVLFSVPLFLLIVLLIVVFVLANYSGNEPVKGLSAEEKASEVNKDAKNEGA
jgi:ABC-type microcin C transport system permease subunit YejB